MNNNLEIERKWLVKGNVPTKLELLYSQIMRQGYISTNPTVRIREEDTILSNVDDVKVKNSFILCFKSHGSLSRKEIELEIDKEKFDDLEDLIGLLLINKKRDTYLLSDGNKLEVNHVDEGLKTEFWYAEIEFKSEEEANRFDPKIVGLEEYLVDEVTYDHGQSMAAYWKNTRLNK